MVSFPLSFCQNVLKTFNLAACLSQGIECSNSRKPKPRRKSKMSSLSLPTYLSIYVCARTCTRCLLSKLQFSLGTNSITSSSFCHYHSLLTPWCHWVKTKPGVCPFPGPFPQLTFHSLQNINVYVGMPRASQSFSDWMVHALAISCSLGRMDSDVRGLLIGHWS